MAFSAAFKALAADPSGEPMQTRLHVRLNDGTGGAPGTLITFSGSVLEVSEISFVREAFWGVVQGQDFMVRVSDLDLAMMQYEFKGCWACVEGSFDDADEQAVLATGRIACVVIEERTLTFEIHDVVMDLLRVKLRREVNFDTTAAVSEVSVVSKAASSSDYNNAYLPTLNTPADIDDETFVIEWTSSTAFKIILEDGDDSQLGIKSSNCTFDNVDGDENIITIPYSAWSGGTFAEGDKYEFHTSRARTTSELSAVNMIAHIIEDVLEIQVYDVINGQWCSSPLYDTTNWTTLGTEAAGHEVNGNWAKGSDVARMVQDLLKVVHGSVFSAPTGQLALWVVQPANAVTVTLNGALGTDDPISVLKTRATDSLKDVANEVTFKYLSLDGGDAVLTRFDDDGEFAVSKVIDIGWGVRGLSIDSSASKYLTRFSRAYKGFDIATTLAGITVEIGNGVAVTDPDAGVEMEVSEVADVVLNPIENSATLKAHIDPLMKQGYAIVDVSNCDDPDAVVW